MRSILEGPTDSELPLHALRAAPLPMSFATGRIGVGGLKAWQPSLRALTVRA
jgi:hypothetical protein